MSDAYIREKKELERAAIRLYKRFTGGLHVDQVRLKVAYPHTTTHIAAKGGTTN